MQETTENTAATTTASTPAAPRTDRLELTKELGRGSIGIVHKARNSQSGRVIALRQFEVPQWLDDVNDLLKQILAEAKAASALEHDHIGRLYTCGYKGFTVFLTSEFVDGETLKSVMALRPLEMAEVLTMTRQLCEALDYAHDKGVFHHFLSPHNIKIQPDGSLKILDFGILRDKHLLSQTPTKKLENEPYLSPEQVRNKMPDRASNLFSLATIVYEMYTARNPFAGMHLGEVDRALTDIMPHPLNVAHPRVGPAVSAVVLKALSKNPADRYVSGKEFFTALEEAAKIDPMRAAAPTPKADATGTQEAVKIAAKNGTPGKAPAPEPMATATFAPPREARVQVRSANHWKLLGAVAACLFVVALLAFMFKRRPTAAATETAETQPVAIATPTPAPIVIPTPDALASPEPEATPDEVPAAVETTITKIRTAKKAKAARAAAAAAIPASEGQVMVASIPSDASVEIEGLSGLWHSPQTIKAIAPGTYRVTTSKPGYAPDVRSVQVNGGGRTVVDVRLTPVKGFLNVGGTPSGASVLINGRDTGKVTPTSFILEPATHALVLRKTGYLDSTMDIQLAAGQTVSYSPSMLAAGRTDNIKIVGGGGIGKIFGGGGGSAEGRARIEIKTDPKGAQVIINGTQLQKNTPLEIQVEAGNYEITLRKDGYKTVHESAIVGPDDRVKIEKSLSR
ncbi:MAG TPA: PEGA domain-containing protein [Candidatus Angelobacter sp.]|nr:PEGA domain-containing protein [Candidatus Angelobacter sp.]